MTSCSQLLPNRMHKVKGFAALLTHENEHDRAGTVHSPARPISSAIFSEIRISFSDPAHQFPGFILCHSNVHLNPRVFGRKTSPKRCWLIFPTELQQWAKTISKGSIESPRCSRQLRLAERVAKKARACCVSCTNTLFISFRFLLTLQIHLAFPKQVQPHRSPRMSGDRGGLSALLARLRRARQPPQRRSCPPQMGRLLRYPTTSPKTVDRPKNGA